MTHTNDQDRALIAFGRAVRQLREERNISERDLAVAAGLTLKRLDAIEVGRSDLRYDVLLALARGLGITSAELVRRAGHGG